MKTKILIPILMGFAFASTTLYAAKGDADKVTVGQLNTAVADAVAAEAALRIDEDIRLDMLITNLTTRVKTLEGKVTALEAKDMALMDTDLGLQAQITVYHQQTYQIGDTGPAGGIVFEVDGNGGGLEAAPADYITIANWCHSALSSFTLYDMPTLDNLIHLVPVDWTSGPAMPDNKTGAENTAIIIGVSDEIHPDDAVTGFTRCSNVGYHESAAVKAVAYTGSDVNNPTTGWHLPNIDELRAMYENIGLGGDGLNEGDFTPYPYWSSTEFGKNYAWYLSFAAEVEGNVFHGKSRISFKTIQARIRPVRAF